jgi:A/G-specific adenine glycosylase
LKFLSSLQTAATTPDDSFADALVAWQQVHGRHHLPWQLDRTPYRVWLSEIMLQQTQVGTVLGYYTRFLNHFPTVQSLANASIDDVLALWSGLGYYSRARNLHACAQIVTRQHQGVFPSQSAQLTTLPGIGPSTAAAIAAFCFHERVSILDGNVKRVLSRYLAFDQDLSKAHHARELLVLANRLLPVKTTEMVAYTQGLMDLGSSICKLKTPTCQACPVQSGCAARRLEQTARFPIKTRKIKRSKRQIIWLLASWQQQWWLTKRPDQGIWAGLWSLPELESMVQLDGMTTSQHAVLPTIKHTLTHVDLMLQPVIWHLPDTACESNINLFNGQLGNGRWFKHRDAFDLGLPAAVRQLLVSLMNS